MVSLLKSYKNQQMIKLTRWLEIGPPETRKMEGLIFYLHLC